MKVVEFLELWSCEDDHENSEFCQTSSGPEKDDEGCSVEVAKVISVTGRKKHKDHVENL